MNKEQFINELKKIDVGISVDTLSKLKKLLDDDSIEIKIGDNECEKLL